LGQKARQKGIGNFVIFRGSDYSYANMIFENPVFITLVLTGLIFILSGLIMKRYPPRNINHFYGYRTKASMASKERWDFAQEYSSRELIYQGIIMSLLSFFALLFDFLPPLGLFISIILVLASCVLMLLRTEKALKKKFDNG